MNRFREINGQDLGTRGLMHSAVNGATALHSAILSSREEEGFSGWGMIAVFGTCFGIQGR